MALFTDGPVSCILDLTARDSQLLNVAVAEGIDVTQKLALAQDELALEVSMHMSSAGLAGDLGSVVVTPPLKLWHTLRTLELVYADAYCSQLNDRYAGKRDQFRRLAERAFDTVMQSGIGIAACPVGQPGIPDAVAVAPSQGNLPLPDATYFVTVAWVNAQGEEGASATPAAVTTASGSLLVRPGATARNGTAWNVYVGASPETMSLQNPEPLAPGQSWLQPGSLNTNGRAPGTGQAPAFLHPLPRLLQRG